MSDIVALTRLRLVEMTPVTTLVGTKVYSGILPQSFAPPAVLVQRVGEVQSGHLRGGNTLRMTRVQVTSVGSTRAEAAAVDEAVEGDGAGSGLSHWRGGIGSPATQVQWSEPSGVVEDYTAGELKQFRFIRDFRMHHR